MKNQEIARIFRDIADILEIKGANPFRVRAYQRAAQNIEGLREDIEALCRQGRLSEIPGIGKDLSGRIQEFLDTGTVSFYDDIRKTVPAGLLDLLDIPTVGPKTAKLLYEKLGIEGIPDLERAIRAGSLLSVPGIKEKTIQNIRKGIEVFKKGKERMTLAQADETAARFLEPLAKRFEVKKISVAGSLRRRKDTVGDIDILVSSTRPQEVMKAFVGLEPVKEVLAEGDTKSAVRTADNTQVDCRVVPQKSYGAALLYFTGSKAFNIKLRQMAIKKGLKINEYGVFRKERFVAGRSEQEIFGLLGMQYVEPEMREDTGEIERALGGKLPVLIEEKDVRGDLHAHSSWSDGSNTVLEMAQAAQKKGYSYLAITDHSEGLKVAGGLSRQALKKKKEEVERANARLKGFRVLFAAEVDIDSQGSLDYPESVLAQFDLVVGAIHSGFKQSREQLTRRIVRACKNKYCHIIAHPTGRLFGARESYDIDLKEVFSVAAGTNTALEINAFPSRLDLNDIHARAAKEAGVKLSLGSDAHESGQLAVMKYGVSVARRAWLTAKDVLNCLDAEQLLRAIRK